jgi:hypothetical protein
MGERRTQNEERRTQQKTGNWKRSEERNHGRNREQNVRRNGTQHRDRGCCRVDGSIPSWLVLVVVISSSFFVLSSPGLSAQRGQPIYPAYDGYVKNPDGSYTLSFAYFSHNAETVSIAPGGANAFAPAPIDRQQPTVFKPGHWRFQCVMVVGPEFDGKMQWSLTYAGTTTGTSERMLQSNWNLVEGAAELSRIDFANARRGVCLNRAPIVRLLGKTARKGEVSIDATTSEELHLFGSVNDEGLPRGQNPVVGWKMLSNATEARTKASFTTAGRYELELSATDSELATSLRVIVNVR